MGYTLECSSEPICDLSLCNSTQPRWVVCSLFQSPAIKGNNILLMLMLEYNLTSGLETLCAFTFHPNSIITNKITSSSLSR